MYAAYKVTIRDVSMLLSVAFISRNVKYRSIVSYNAPLVSCEMMAPPSNSLDPPPLMKNKVQVSISLDLYQSGTDC